MGDYTDGIAGRECRRTRQCEKPASTATYDFSGPFTEHIAEHLLSTQRLSAHRDGIVTVCALRPGDWRGRER
jgi:hypothetical protein